MSTIIGKGHTCATAHVVDACMRLSVPFRVAPFGIQAMTPVPSMLCGPAVPVRHYGSVDIFLEVLECAPNHGILVIDNQARQDEACIGDLIVLEAKNAGLQAIVVRGLHRDTRELARIGLPIFSYGSYPAGPSRLDNREPDAFTRADFGAFCVSRSDTVLADQDGVVFIETRQADAVLQAAEAIRETEQRQVSAVMDGQSLREQFQLQAFLAQRERNAEYTFRQHLRSLAKAVEE